MEGADAILIDNASDTFGGNENGRAEVKKFVRLLAQEIARKNDAGLMLLAHVDKASAKFGAKGNSYSGSTAWHNSARSRLALLDENGALELRHEKANFSACASPVTLTRNPDGVLMPANAGAVALASKLIETTKLEHDKQRVLELLGLAIEGIRCPCCQWATLPPGTF